MKLKDKVAIITGGGRGIGREYALRFAEEGAKVVIPDIIFENAQKVAGEIKSKGGEGLAVHTDVADEASVAELVKKTIDRFGRVDILVNNAAILWVEAKRWDAWLVKDWEQILAVNLIGTWLCIKAVVPIMIAQGKGKIINIHSTTDYMGRPHNLPYTCSKGAVAALSRSLARALGRYNINVNCISPGFTVVELTSEVVGGPEKLDKMIMADISRKCFQRAGYPNDLVGAATFLASEDSDFITGQVLVVDGGDMLR